MTSECAFQRGAFGSSLAYGTVSEASAAEEVADALEADVAEREWLRLSLTGWTELEIAELEAAALETVAVEETALVTATLEAAELEIADTVVAEAADDVPSAAGAGAAALYVARRTEQIIALVKLSILYLASGRWTG